MSVKKTAGKKKGPDPFDFILSGKRLTFEIVTRRGRFEIALPLPSDIRKIELLVVERLEGKPYTSFTPEALANVRVYATLDTVVTKAPAWWKRLRSCESCPDDELITDLYRGYLRHYKKTQESLAAGSSTGSSVGTAEHADEAEAMGDGTFQGIAN